MTNSSITNNSENYRTGFVKLIGNPNVGKSALMNQLCGEKTTNFPSETQTTSPRALGVINGDNFQIVYSDLPDVLAPADKMPKKTIGQVVDLLQDTDIILYLTDCGDTCYNAELVKNIKVLGIPIVVVINQIDKYTEEQVTEASTRWSNIFPEADLFAVSTLTGQNIDGLRERIISLLPETPPYPISSDRYFIAELIREQILLQYKKEIADCANVRLENYEKKENFYSIKATVYVEWDTQKDIIIGSKGSAIMKFGNNTRDAIKDFFQERVDLELDIKALKRKRN